MLDALESEVALSHAAGEWRHGIASPLQRILAALPQQVHAMNLESRNAPSHSRIDEHTRIFRCQIDHCES